MWGYIKTVDNWNNKCHMVFGKEGTSQMDTNSNICVLKVDFWSLRKMLNTSSSSSLSWILSISKSQLSQPQKWLRKSQPLPPRECLIQFHWHNKTHTCEINQCYEISARCMMVALSSHGRARDTPDLHSNQTVSWMFSFSFFFLYKNLFSFTKFTN